jgi:rhamnulokinase
VIGKTSNSVPVVRVGGHDTASAVCGLGALESNEAFLNVGTWSLLGCMLDQPLVTAEAEEANFSNERAVDGRIRFLKNIPGFYVINRLREELGITSPVPEWVSRADQSYGERIDLFHPDLFNPPSMLKAVRSQIKEDPPTSEAWAGLVLMSLAEGAADQLHRLERITGRVFSAIRLAGGGSQSRAFCEALANVTSKAVLAGPHEATVLGNLGAQFLAQGCFDNWMELGDFLRRQNELAAFFPGI